MQHFWLIAGVLTCWLTGGEPSALEQRSPGGTRLRLLFSDPQLLGQVEISDSMVALYASPADKLANKPEIVVFRDEFAQMASLFNTLSDSSLLKIYKSKGSKKLNEILPKDSIPLTGNLIRANANHHHPLAGIRIALDPGHLAGTFAEAESLEYRFMKVRPNPADTTQEYRFFEANLALATARLLQRWLVADGATVFLTHSQPGVGALGMSFVTWEQQELPNVLRRLPAAERKYYTTEATRAQIYQNLFLPQDLRARADSINAFNPDFTLILHYNVHLGDLQDRDRLGYTKACTENYAMNFVPGSFMGKELSRPEDRLALLRMLLTDDVPESIRLSAAVSDAFCQLADVPPAGLRECGMLGYLGKASQPTGKIGVYARNLSLTRLVRSPICYGEPLCQNNLQEAIALSQQNYEEGGIATSQRVVTIAQAYYAGIRQYCSNTKVQN